MTYRIARNGQNIGTFSLQELRQEIAAGRVADNDLVQTEGMEEWLPIAEMFPGSQMLDERRPSRLYADPPDLRWWLALIFGVLTLGAFFVIWDVVQAAWLRRVERRSLALILYSFALVLYVLNLPTQWASISHALFYGPLVDTPFALWCSLGGITTRLVARFVMRNDVCRHFTLAEPIGIRLNWFLTLLLGGLYFQYHFNEVNEAKQHMRVSVPGV